MLEIFLREAKGNVHFFGCCYDKLISSRRVVTKSKLEGNPDSDFLIEKSQLQMKILTTGPQANYTRNLLNLFSLCGQLNLVNLCTYKF